jgi:transposase
MAGRRISMRKIKEVLRLNWSQGLSARQIARSCGIARSTVQEFLNRAQVAGLSWPLPPEIDDFVLENQLFPPKPPGPVERQAPDMAQVHKELRRAGVTLQLLWFEYKEQHPEGFQYSQFCNLYRHWAKKLDYGLRQEYRAGEKVFVDFSGQKIAITNPLTGEVTCHSLFVAVWGASNYTYAEACPSEDLPSWITAHVRAFQFFGCLPKVLVPDNPKVGVTKPCRYDPELNPTYQEMAHHYGLAVIPARVRKPKDKAKVEAGVLVVERWILAALRNRTFFSLSEANQAIRELLKALNERPFKKILGSRKELFMTLDKPAARPLGPPYQYADWFKARVNVDCHIEVEGHYYSTPYPLVHEPVDVRLTPTTVEVFFKSRRVASHARNFLKGRFTTTAEHLPPQHPNYLKWTPERIIGWTQKIGPHTASVAQEILQSKEYPEQGFRACLGLIRLADRYSSQRLEAACLRASQIKSPSYKSVKSILKTGLDKQPLSTHPQPLTLDHPHIRGQAYYR